MTGTDGRPDRPRVPRAGAIGAAYGRTLDLLRGRLTELGIPPGSAENWALVWGWPLHTPEGVERAAQECLAFHNAGISAEAAAGWVGIGATAEEAIPWAAAGYTPKVLQHLADFTDENAVEWLEAGFYGADTLTYVKAGISVTEAITLRASHPHGDVDRVVRLLAVLRSRDSGQ